MTLCKYRRMQRPEHGPNEQPPSILPQVHTEGLCLINKQNLVCTLQYMGNILWLLFVVPLLFLGHHQFPTCLPLSPNWAPRLEHEECARTLRPALAAAALGPLAARRQVLLQLLPALVGPLARRPCQLRQALGRARALILARLPAPRVSTLPVVQRREQAAQLGRHAAQQLVRQAGQHAAQECLALPERALQLLRAPTLQT